MKKAFTLPIFLVFLALFFPASTFAQAEQEIPQSVIINGRQTHGVTVLQNGAIQSFNCPSPQPYTSSDGATSGWACLDTHTGTWLLNALPPQSIGTYPAEIPLRILLQSGIRIWFRFRSRPRTRSFRTWTRSFRTRGTRALGAWRTRAWWRAPIAFAFTSAPPARSLSGWALRS